MTWQPTELDNPLRIIPCLSDGTLDPGNPYVRANRDWYDLIHDTTRTKATVPTLAEWCRRFGVVLMRNNLQLAQPMAFDQAALLKQSAAANPGDADLQAKADLGQYVRAKWDLAEAGIDIIEYTGAPRRFARVGNETPDEWVRRAMAAIAPHLAATKAILFDNTMGFRHRHYPWANLTERLLFQALTTSGLAVGCEPTNYVDSVDYLGEAAKFLSVDFLHSQEAKNPGETICWKVRDPAVDHAPMQVAGALGEPVYLWLDFRSTPAYDGDPRRDPLGYITTIHERWPNAWLCAPFGWLPKELIDA